MTTEFMNSLNTFYSLKSQYDSNNNKEKKKIINNEELSWKEKRKQFKSLQPKCINCKKSGGTLFTIEYDEAEDGRIAKAICGHRTDPCPLDIFINLGSIMSIGTYLKQEEADLTTLKNDIIQDKNKLLFGYITAEEAIEKFESVKDILSSTTSSYELFFEKYVLRTDSSEKKELIKKARLAIFADVSLMKESMTQFDRSGSEQFVTDAVTVYIEQLLPKLKELQKLVYPYSSTECVKNICTLVQKRITTEELEDNFANNDIGVKSFVVGMARPRERANRQQNIEDEAEFLQ